ncbi:MAG: hypothetical protein GTO45_06710 [Candidatus Aminicenantes bacterium]|nr:hypothetical protein [Candidatus Aminicenantes bacterium]NIM78533.1 hypothetical protein [Candidatus Aminicenantes bacterium]NIN17778.1 hypothetical protein [Candidatus Aminicenantes bacterium]NIN41680.1 hypothetical protein [Candidatus Aminicenantes bacterium]NIN84429.1 hypothetical protein [Candidatus Aminicenantes bacterium]
MDRKKLITKMALAAIFILIISCGGLIYESLHEIKIEKKKANKKNYRIEELTRQCQKFLDETAAKIKSLPVNPLVLSQIKSEIFKKSTEAKAYLWMSNTKGEFIFGVPHPVFTRLNGIFDKNRTVIEKRGYIVDRNDFLLKFVDKHNKIRFSHYDFSGPLEERGFRYSSGMLVVFSSPVIDQEQQVIGDLYLKVDDYGYRYDYRDRYWIQPVLFQLAHILLGISAVFLWLLLPSWVYIDARKRDVKRAFMWAILTVVSFGFAFIVYIITRPAELKTFHCPECEKELNGTKAFCPYCGLDLSSTICPQCQYSIKPDWQFCPNCRCDLTQKSHEEIPGETDKPAEPEAKKIG